MDDDEPAAAQAPPVPPRQVQEDDAPYGPADPAYGPPDPSWYERRQRELREEEARAQAAPAEDAGSARGPFDPPPKAEPDPWGGLLDDDNEELDSQDPLSRVKSLYQTAQGLGDDTLDRRFEELLERQRKLISTFLDHARPDIPDPEQVIDQLTSARQA